MIWLLIPIVVFVAVLRDLHSYMMLDGFIDAIGSILFAALFSLLGLLASIVIAAGIGLSLDTEYVKVSETSLIALRDKDGVEGSFFLGTGSIEGSPYYFFYQGRSDGTFSPGKLKADGSVSVDERGQEGTATLTRYKCVFVSDVAHFVAMPPCTSRYTITVPPGTVRRGFTL